MFCVPPSSHTMFTIDLIAEVRNHYTHSYWPISVNTPQSIITMTSARKMGPFPFYLPVLLDVSNSIFEVSHSLGGISPVRKIRIENDSWNPKKVLLSLMFQCINIYDPHLFFGLFPLLRYVNLPPNWFKYSSLFHLNGLSRSHWVQRVASTNAIVWKILFSDIFPFFWFCVFFYTVVLYLHSLRMRSSGLLLIFLGKSIFSMPFKMNVYVIIWSLPEKGGLWSNNSGKSTLYGCCSLPYWSAQHRIRQDTIESEEDAEFKHVTAGSDYQTHWPSSEQLKHQDTQRPEVHTEVVALVKDDLRGHILWSPTEGPGLLATSHLFGKTKVNLESQSWSIHLENSFGNVPQEKQKSVLAY